MILVLRATFVSLKIQTSKAAAAISSSVDTVTLELAAAEAIFIPIFLAQVQLEDVEDCLLMSMELPFMSHLMLLPSQISTQTPRTQMHSVGTHLELSGAPTCLFPTL